MSNVRKITFQETTRAIDKETGEITQESTTSVVRLPAEPPYVKLYLDDLCALVNVQDGQKRLLLALLRRLDYDGYIALTPRFRKELCEKLDIKDQTLRNQLTGLVKSDLLRKAGTNEYIANPNFFARGEWKNIVEQRAAFQMRITYTEAGRKIVTERAEVQADWIDDQK